MSAVPHQHNLGDISVALVITIMYLIRWQNNMLPARLLQGHNLVSTIAATGAFEKFQEEKPPMTREKNGAANMAARPQMRTEESWSGKDLCCNMYFKMVSPSFKCVCIMFSYRASMMHYLTWAEFQQAYARRLWL